MAVKKKSKKKMSKKSNSKKTKTNNKKIKPLKPLYSVVLPVFNEEKNIELIAQKYSKINEILPIEVIFVEDSGSNDNTRGEILRMKKKYPFVKELFTNERGYGISIYNGLLACTSDILCWTHADMQTDPADTFKAFKILARKKPEARHKYYIKGKRHGRPLLDTFFTKGMSAFETIYMGTRLSDINAQPNMMHKDFLRKMRNPPKDFSFDLYSLYIAKKTRMKIIRFSVEFKKRLHGTSNWNTGLKSKYKFIKRTLSFSRKLKKSLR